MRTECNVEGVHSESNIYKVRQCRKSKAIKSVSEFLNAVELVNKKYGDRGEIYYRGQSKNYGETNFLPNIFRNLKNSQDVMRKETEISDSFLNRFPGEFANMNNFSRLAKMQHNRLPTRLLDITRNPLIALYFAVSNINDSSQDPKVYLFSDQSQNDEQGQLVMRKRSNNSDLLNIGATEAFLKYERKVSLLKILTDFNNVLEAYKLEVKRIGFKRSDSGFLFQKLSPRITISEKEKLNDATCIGAVDSFDFFYSWFTHNKKYRDSVSERENSEDDLRFNGDQNYDMCALNSALTKLAGHYVSLINSYELENFYHNMDIDTTVFRRIPNISQFNQSYFAVPPVVDQRIKNQNGLFIMPIIESSPRKAKESIRSLLLTECTIDGRYKKRICRELDDFCGINYAFVYPDLESAADYLSDRFND